MFRSTRTRRLTWEIEPGLNYVRDPNHGLRQYRGTFGASLQAGLPRLMLESAYRTEMELNTIGRTETVRTHSVLFSLSSARNYRIYRIASLGGSISTNTRRAELTLSQTIRITHTLDARLSYARSGLWWEDASSGAHRRRTSDMIAFNLQWSFL